jgi:hypothetical protein
MTRWLVLLGVLLITPPVYGQQAAAPGDVQKPTPGEGQPSPSVDAAPRAEALGVSVARIKRQLMLQPLSNQPSGLKLDFYVEVYGRPIPLEWMGDFSLWKTGAVPYGAPTHRELVDNATPQEFRSPVMDIGAAARAVATWLQGR